MGDTAVVIAGRRWCASASTSSGLLGERKEMEISVESMGVVQPEQLKADRGCSGWIGNLHSVSPGGRVPPVVVAAQASGRRRRESRSQGEGRKKSG